MKFKEILEETKKPTWWYEKTNNKYIKDNITKGDEIMDWLHRHDIRTENGKYIFYHATPKTNNLTVLRSSSLLAENKKDAIHFAKRDRGLKSTDINVIKLYLNPEDIIIGVFASLRNPYKIVKE